MAEPENSDGGWFILHEDQRFGPFTLEELRFGVENKEINPRYDMAWKEGMADWIPAGQVEGLFERNPTPESQPKKEGEAKKEGEKETKQSSAFSHFEEDVEAEEEEQEWEGVSRGGYFFFIYLFPIIWYTGLFFGVGVLKDLLDFGILQIVVGCLMLLPFLLYIFATLQRFQNLAMSRLWFFGLLVPLLNLWLGYRLFACPPGYAEKKKLGALGWFLAFIYWSPFILIIALVGFLVSQPDIIKDALEKNRPRIEEYMDQAKKMAESPEQKKEREAEEKAAKGPSIVPMGPKNKVDKGPSIIPAEPKNKTNGGPSIIPIQ